MADTTKQTPDCTNPKGLSLVSTALLGLASLGLVACSSGGSSTNNDDGGGGGAETVKVSVAETSVDEGNVGAQKLIFTVSLSEALASDITVDYAVSDGTAVAGSDYYIPTSTTLTIPANSTTATISITVISDMDFEFDETLTLTLSNPAGVDLGTATATGTITNDDNATTAGYFTGSANVNGKLYEDVIALAYNNRIMLFSPLANVLYDIKNIKVTASNFTGDVDVYDNGNITVETITVSGTTNESQVKATFAGGTGFGAGSFDILFDIANNRGATLARIEMTSLLWEGGIYGIDVDTGTLSSNKFGLYVVGDDTIERCIGSGDFGGVTGIPDPNVNIYRMAHDVVDQAGAFDCGITYKSTGHTGFASVIDNIATDDRVVFGFANGTFALFGILDKQ